MYQAAHFGPSYDSSQSEMAERIQLRYAGRNSMEPLAKEKNRPTIINLNPDDPTDTTLSRYAGRTGKLLTDPAVQANSDLAGSLDDFLGAVYALILAKHHHFADRVDRPIDITPVAKRAARIAAGRVRTNGQWIAGFYFNNALFRTAAVYHRILKIVVEEKAYVSVLLPKAQRLYPRWTNVKLNKIHNQVNDLKHTARGVYDHRTVTYDDAVASIGELLELIEAWTAAKAPSTSKK
jgi:hypothetical protein